MFRIPDFYQLEMSFDEAWDIMKRHGRGDCLEGMKAMDRLWIEYCSSPDQDDDELFSGWIYEFNAFNVVFEGMSGLFAAEAA